METLHDLSQWEIVELLEALKDHGFINLNDARECDWTFDDVAQIIEIGLDRNLTTCNCHTEDCEYVECDDIYNTYDMVDPGEKINYTECPDCERGDTVPVGHYTVNALVAQYYLYGTDRDFIKKCDDLVDRFTEVFNKIKEGRS